VCDVCRKAVDSYWGEKKENGDENKKTDSELMKSLYLRSARFFVHKSQHVFRKTYSCAQNIWIQEEEIQTNLSESSDCRTFASRISE